MRGNLSFYMYMMLVILIGMVLVVAVLYRINPLGSENARAQELAIFIAMNINSLSTVDEGSIKLDTGEYRYDIEIEKKDSFWRTIGNYITSYVDRNGYYVAVSAYKRDGTKIKPKIFIINSYKLDKDYNVVVENTNSLCIRKEKSDDVAKVVKCGE